MRRLPGLVAKYSQYIGEQINTREHDEVERLEAEYADYVVSLAKADASIVEVKKKIAGATRKTEKGNAETSLSKLAAQRERPPPSWQSETRKSPKSVAALRMIALMLGRYVFCFLFDCSQTQGRERNHAKVFL